MTSKTYHLGIIGHPLGHTLSPQLQTAFLKQAGLSGIYEVWDTVPEDLPEMIKTLKQHAIDGFNVTIPYKTRIMPLLDEIDPLAKAIGAVNTVVISSKGLQGFNTDCDGFWDSLPPSLQQNIVGSKVILLGAGGAARAVGAAMIRGGAQSLVLVARNLDQAAQTRAVLNACAALLSENPPKISLLPYQAFDGSQCGAIINTTPVGMSGDLLAMPLTLSQIRSLPDSAWVIDLIYKPHPTQFLKLAQAQGYATLDGLGMLLHQGALAFTHWTGVTLPQTCMDNIFRQFA
ncbi:MAG: shikimate dehydrogenase [Vampirovibrionales bacterium]|nr:shikimate dehydrogenase [Vampirovibrionales bacterium]